MRSIIGQARGEFRDFEEKAMPLATALMPIGPAALRQVMIRLIAFHVADPATLVRFIVPRHVAIMQNYGYSPEEDPARSEGTSIFWLLHAMNPSLQAMEVAFGPGILESLEPSVHSVYAIRCFLRMQALLMDIDQVGKIIEIHELYLQNIPEDLLPVSGCGRIDVENFEPVAGNLDDDEIAGAARRRLSS
ncbi:hypothetical protein [Paracoccus sp. ME4]|uniref:hypothetical protein n=1 Tax=Paracoccus sp. ME4 TaxID=3138066 RepID=UPI00398AF010